MSDRTKRYKPTGPFAWLSKEALKRIRDGWDGEPGLSNGLAVYLTMAETANREGSPTFERRQRDIAATSGCSARTVARVLQNLRRMGVINWTQTTGEGTHPLGPNIYTVTSYPSATNAHPSANTADPSASPRNGTVAENVEEPLEELQKNPLKNIPPVSRVIEEVYQAYPRKEAKGAALKAIAKALKTGAPAETLLAQVRLYADAVSRWPAEAKQFIPHPATWFNDQRWLDDPAMWERKPVNKSNTGGTHASGQSDGGRF